MCASAKCTRESHERMKRDSLAWSLLEYVGKQHVPADEHGPALSIELKNCGQCHSTLAKEI